VSSRLLGLLPHSSKAGTGHYRTKINTGVEPMRVTIPESQLTPAARWWRRQSDKIDLAHQDNQRALNHLPWQAIGAYLKGYRIKKGCAEENKAIKDIFHNCVCTWTGWPIGYRKCGGQDKKACWFFDLLKALGTKGIRERITSSSIRNL